MSNFLTCEQLEPLLSAFHDGELGERERADAEQHLSNCAMCQNRLLEIGAVSSSLKALPTLSPKMDVAANIEKLIAAQPAPVSSIRKPIIWSAVGIAAAAAVVFFVGNLNPGAPNVASNKNINKNISKNDANPAVHVLEHEVASAPAVDSIRVVNVGKNTGVGEQPVTKKNGTADPAQSNKQNGDRSGNTKRIRVNQRLQIADQPNGGTEAVTIAAKPVVAPQRTISGVNSKLIATAITDSRIGQTNVNSELIAVYDTDQRNVTEDLGITTDEDGLYAIKL